MKRPAEHGSHIFVGSSQVSRGCVWRPRGRESSRDFKLHEHWLGTLENGEKMYSVLLVRVLH